MTVPLDVARTWLFVPGSRPDRYAKAAASGADAVVLDLEDGVAATDKHAAREHVRRWLSGRAQAVVRINPAASPWYEGDVHALQGSPTVVMLPKVADPEDVRQLMARLPVGSTVVPVLESAAGIVNAYEICRVPGVVRSVFGNGDLAAELGVMHDDLLALAYSRSAVVLAAAAAGVAPPVDGVTTRVDDVDRLLADIRHAARLGFTGKVCIHPRQVDLVAAGFVPDSDRLAWAERVAGAGGGSVLVGGEMVDAPVKSRAQALLASEGLPATSHREADL